MGQYENMESSFDKIINEEEGKPAGVRTYPDQAVGVVVSTGGPSLKDGVYHFQFFIQSDNLKQAGEKLKNYISGNE